MGPLAGGHPWGLPWGDSDGNQGLKHLVRVSVLKRGKAV